LAYPCLATAVKKDGASIIDGVLQPRSKAAGLFLILAILYYWRILIGHQFSLLTGYEGTNQAYAWLTYLAGSLHAGAMPLWDPYSFSGHPFVEEMQSGAFYPVNLLAALWPLNQNGVFSPGLYHWIFALTHALGGFFLFLLARELGLSFFAGVIAGCGFAFGGTMARSGGWPHLYQSFIWFPPTFFFLLRALRARIRSMSLLNAAMAGACIALAILAGGLYSAMMQAALVVGFSAFWMTQSEERNWTRAIAVTAMAGAIAGLAGAAQLLPSAAGSGHTLRSVGAPSMLPASDKIPYTYISAGIWAHSFIGLFLMPTAFGGNLGSGENPNPYMGVLVCALALIGIWKRWRNPCVRFFAALVAVSFAYSMGGSSIIHGVLYAIVPRLWMAREAGRGLYLANFALAVLCAYGADALFSSLSDNWEPLRPILKWACIVCGGILVAGATFSKVEMSSWISLSLVLILVSSALIWRVATGARGIWAKTLFVGVLLFDLYAFDWAPVNVIQERARGTDEFARLMKFQSAAAFLNHRPGPFRVQVLTEPLSNIGDTFGVEGTWGASATVLKDYWDYRDFDVLWNIGYKIRPASANDPGPIYSDANYKIYENAGGARAWTVHKLVVEPSEEKLAIDLRQPGFNPAETALVLQPVTSALGDAAAEERVVLGDYDPEAPVLRVTTGSTALLVVSEVFDSSWRATVNGASVPIQRVDGALRGVVIPKGFSLVEFKYRPIPVYAGIFLSLATFLALAGAWIRHRSRSSAKSPTTVNAEI
jgi:hypothetical protein